jgi:RimJ/RimL family protein N-acetyltransferase
VPESLGDPVPGWRPRSLPARVVREGATARTEPLDPAAHAAALFAVSHAPPADPYLWDYLPYGPFADEPEFRDWLGTLATEDDPLFFALVDRRTQASFGMASFLRAEAEHGSIEIGHIWVAGTHQRTRQATEALYLLIRHALGDLGYRRLEWKCNALNGRSRVAAQRLGFRFEGVFRHHQVIKGRNRDTAWFSIVDSEWPAVQAGFQRWLADDNFDAEGQQRHTLTQAREHGGVPPTAEH